MSAAKSILLLIGFGTSFITSKASTNIPVDASSGEVVYRKSFQFNTAVSEDDAYTIMQDWFTANKALFTSQNMEAPASQSKSRAEVENEFKNPMPLQSLDPESKRLNGKGVIKYVGGTGSSIGVLYMEYYVSLVVNGHTATITIDQMKYHHFNCRNYNEKPIYAWSGGKPFESADKLAKLVASDKQDMDIVKLNTFLNEDINKLLNNLQSFLSAKNLVAKN